MQHSLKLISVIFFLGLMITPAFAQRVAESDGTQTDLLAAIHIVEPEVKQIFLETLRIDERHFYTFDAAQGESINIQMFVPILDGLQNYAPTIAFYKVGEQKEFVRYIPELFFGEIMATPQTTSMLGENWFVRQNIQTIIDETGTYVVEVFDEGDCIVRGIPDSPTAKFIEKKCVAPDFFFVLVGKYGLQFGTEERSSVQDNLQTTLFTRAFFEDPLSTLLTGFVVDTIETQQGKIDSLRIFGLFLLAIVVIVLIAKRNSFRKI